MKKFIVTDEAGMTAVGVKVEPGKQIQVTGSKNDPMTRIQPLCKETPLLAALASPRSYPKAKLFLVNTWSVAVEPGKAQSYTMVKPEAGPAPAVGLEQKLAFAMTVLKTVHKNEEFRRWAENWLAGKDRTEATARAVRTAIESELKSENALDALAEWGASADAGADHSQDITTRRSLRVVQAAEAVARDGFFEAKPVIQVLAPVLAHLDEYAGQVDLAACAEQAVGKPAPVTTGISSAA